MNTYDRHLLREWLNVLGLVLGAMIGLLFVQVLYDDFSTLMNLGATTRDVGMYFLVTLPSFLGLVLPIGLLISLLYVLGKLHRANELIALRAAGVGILRITAPVWLVGVLACGVAWLLNASVVPWSVEASRALRDTLEYRHQSGLMPEDRIGAVPTVAFDNRVENRMWYFNRYSKYTDRGYGVSVSILDAQRREVRRILARQAWYDRKSQGWHFLQGQVLTIDPASEELWHPEHFEELFEADFHEDPGLMLLIDRRPQDLSYYELRRLMDYYAVDSNPKGLRYAVRYFSLLANTLGPLIVIALAIPFTVSGVRVNPAVGVSKSIGLFLLYYVLMNIATALGTQQLMDPVLAAWMPNIGMMAIAGVLFIRLR